jgi:hypothetical protein
MTMKTELMLRVIANYRKLGYTIEKDFPGEYYFMHNPKTLERVRIFYDGSLLEYR